MRISWSKIASELSDVLQNRGNSPKSKLLLLCEVFKAGEDNILCFFKTFCEYESKSLGLDAQSRLRAVPAMLTAFSGAGSGATADDAGRKVDKPVHTK